MKTITWSFLLLFAHYIFANSISLETTECKLMTGEDTILVKPATEFSSICVRNNNEITCIHIDDQGKQINSEDKYKIFFDDDKSFGFWTSPSGNIIMHLNYSKNQFHMGMTYFSDESMLIINKYCIGIIKSH